MKREITVFTPIYNRAYCIEKLYRSLQNQMFKNFEWLVMDDGSTDHVEQLFEKWIKEENEFDIIFQRVENGGKMRTINKAVQIAAAPAFFVVDSDDYISEDALAFLYEKFQEIKDDESFAGISGLKSIKTVDIKYDFDYVDATNLERRKYNLTADMAECYKTEILRKYPAPEIPEENYISPSIVWNRIAYDGYKLRWFNKFIYFCEYQVDGLSHLGTKKYIQNPIGWGKQIQLNIMCKKDKDYAEFQYYWYYQCLRGQLPDKRIAENLGVEETELITMVSHNPSVIEKINRFFESHRIRRIALYGMGGEAKRFLQFSKDFGVEICYGIDRTPNSLIEKCYKLTDNLPEVDAILVTNRTDIKNIKEEIGRHTDMKVLSIQEDLPVKSLNYYFSDI